MQTLDLTNTKITDLSPIADLIHGGLHVFGVDVDRLDAVKATTDGDPLAWDPFCGVIKNKSAQRLEVFFQL